MYTESELRSALEHSASRADALLENVLPISPAHAGPQPGRRRTVGAALAVAATVAAAAVGVTVWARGSDAPHQVAAPTSAPAATTASASPTASTPARGKHIPAELVGLTDVIRIGHADPSMYSTFSLPYEVPGSEEFMQPTGTGPNDRVLVVDVITPDAKGFNAARVPRDHPVPIAGTTGYYGKFAVHPVDGDPANPNAGKWLPTWTIAFRHGENWVFAHLEGSDMASTDDAARIASLYEKYQVNIGAGDTRLPFRTGWLPANMVASGVSVQRVPGTGALTASGATAELYAGHAPEPGSTTISPYIDIEVMPADLNNPVCVMPGSAMILPSGSGVSTPQRCRKIPTRELAGGLRLQIQSDGYDDATIQRVLDTITVASELDDPSTFWTVQEALG